MAAADKYDRITVKSCADLHNWLRAHHKRDTGVWLVTYKKHTDHYLDWGDMISELLCWGWVDSQTRGVDADRTSVLIAPRNPRSAWSAINKEKVAALRAEGRMQPAGEALITAAKANGMWNFLDDVERLEVPADLATALADLRPVWESWPRSVKRATLEWIKTAKRAPTRARRIADVVASAREGLRPSPFRR